MTFQEAKQKEKFEQWAIVELFGHNRIAGLVTEQVIGGCSFVRVDVPALNGDQPFTKLYGNGAIYGMTFVDAETARGAAAMLKVKPVDEWSARKMLCLPDQKVGESQPTGMTDDDDTPW